MTNDCALLFVYGSLRRGCDNAQARLLAEMADWLCMAQARGRLLKIDWYPALVPGDGRVTGDIFVPRDLQATLALLDAYEECTADFPQPWEYRRCVIPVETADGEIQAWTYLYNRPTDGLSVIAGGDWFKI